MKLNKEYIEKIELVKMTWKQLGKIIKAVYDSEDKEMIRMLDRKIIIVPDRKDIEWAEKELCKLGLSPN